MNLTISDCISIVGVVATIFLGLIALWQNARYKKQSDNFIDLQSMPELFPIRMFDITPGKFLEKMPAALHADISENAGNTLYFSILYAENGPVYDLTVSGVRIDGKCLNRNLKCNRIDIYPMNRYLRLTLTVPSELANEQGEHKGKIVLSYKNQYNVSYQKEILFEFHGLQLSAEHMAHAKRK